MAIKGKSRKRAKSRAPALPPKPVVSARKTPLPLRRDVKRALVVTLAVLALLGGLRLWQNVSRSSSLKKYDIKVTTAQLVFSNHFNTQTPGNVDSSVQAFTGGTLKAADFLKLTEAWEKDFRAASEAVAKVKPINKTVEEAQFLMQQGIDGYTRVVRLWTFAGQLKQTADAETDAKRKKALNDQVQAILLQADDIRRGQAEKDYKRGVDLLTELNIEWGLQKKQSEQQQQQQQQQVPQ